MSLIDPSVFAGLKEMSGEELLNELIDAFLDDAPKMTAAMNAALGARDIDAFRRNAHSMKSNADTFGATALAAIARQLEGTARAGSLDVGSRFEDLLAACGAASDELRGLRS